jgi:deazaflavin-dependent oxidoreductase (nitroreductase family)
LTGDERSVGEQLAEWGRVGLLETVGRVSGRAVRTPVGFVEQTDGSMLVAAGGEDVDWALNLRAQPRCRMTIAERTIDCVADEVTGDEHARAVVALILRYGTPAERLGRGPAFRLRPVDGQPR